MSLGILRANELTRLLKINRSTLWRWVKNGGFPKPIRIGTHAIAWRVEDIEEWLASRPTVGEAGS